MKRVKSKVFHTASASETQKFAEGFSRRFSHGVIALSGDLGAGKTTFAQGFARGLGIRRRMTSPTFIFIRRYKIQDTRNKRRCFYHIDAYRARSAKDLASLQLKEVFVDLRNVVLVEWAENVKRFLPKNTLWITMKHGEKENERTIVIE